MVYTRKKRATYFGNIKTLEKVHGFKRFDINPIILISKIIIITLLFLIATGALEIIKISPTTNTDYVIVIDSSSSMANTDLKPNRLEAAKNIASEWLNLLSNNTRVGLVVFSDSIDKYKELTFNKKEIENEIKNIQINYSKTGTNLNFALNTAFRILNESKKNKTVFLLTDGTENISQETIRNAQVNGIKIYSFGLGAKTNEETLKQIAELKRELGEDVNISEYYDPLEFDFKILQQLSEKTNGEAFKINDEKELYNTIKQSTLEKQSIKLNTTYYVVLLLILLLIFEFILYGKYGAL